MLQSISHTNTCIKCGKNRIVIKEWEEINPDNGIKSKKSLSVCPDPSCQEEVDKGILNKQKDREKKEIARMTRLAKMNERFASDN